jgi:arylsulfatase A-like enzyme
MGPVRNILFGSLATVAAVTMVAAPAAAQQPKKPNILVIMADDVGVWNVSAYHRGMMGGSTPNIDSIAKEGALFTDYYSQQSCTAGRASFITGQHPFRTGLLKVGLPGAKQGLQDKDATIAELLKPQGYTTAQIGKNHLGDRNEFLPTVHGFDEFYGNLYHLNAQEEPEDPDYPKNQEFLAKFGPRGVLDCKASSTDDPTVDPRFGKMGKQVCKDTGPLSRKRMETVEEELLERSLAFMDRSTKAGKPFFLWHNPSRMHAFTRLSSKWENKSSYGLYADGMMELDYIVGTLLKKLDDLGVADNTIVVFTSDNGAEIVSWPDGGNTPFKGEKGTTWEGGMRVPGMVRWPGVVKPGTIINDIISQEDWTPTFLAAAGDSDVKTKLLTGLKAGDKTFKVHLDGYNFMPFFKGE